MFSNHRTVQIVRTVYKIHSSKVSIIGDASCVTFDFLYILAIFYDVNSLGGSFKYAEYPMTTKPSTQARVALTYPPSRTSSEPMYILYGIIIIYNKCRQNEG